MPTNNRYSKDYLGDKGTLWRWYKKKTKTMARRVDGPFEVETREGVITCQNGWLAVDAHGYPYPIDAEEFEVIYEEI